MSGKRIFQKNSSLSEWKYQLKNGGFNSILRFSPITTNNSQGESGSTVYRSLSPIIATNEYSLKNEDVEIIILIDDILGSGKQFLNEFAPNFFLKEKLNDKLVIYSPIVAYSKGIEAVNKQYPNLHILPIEIVSEKSNLFFGDPQAKFRNDQINTLQVAKNFFQSMQQNYGSEKSDYWFGYENACLPIVFEWGCPNQAPHILWMKNSPSHSNWKQLFFRRA
ncbi:hypothetical protein HMPREF9371_0545 [Neisseria shayeganii 871]|uniref:PRTase-CE domain-containing protein n=2 Tax=Neisseria shayeganii TaxID=607712 RepID=G4CG06_9NEIS|nr:hypothetical protein HMPREF9371_0545 [Neisseria shayeganii 871]